MKCYKSWYTIFTGWYRQSLSRKSAVWHRICEIDFDIINKQMLRTVCGRSISSIHCDFDMKPEDRCMQCEKPIGVIVESGRCFAPVGSSSILTRSSAISEIKRLLKDRIYYLVIWGKQGVKIIAKWESGFSIDIYSYPEEISPQRKNNVMSLAQIQVDLGRFQSSVDSLCKACDILALQEKKKNRKKGKLTKEESYSYFEKLFYEAEKYS